MNHSVVEAVVRAARAASSRLPGSDWYLFGSCARNAECTGDIDLLVVHDERVDAVLIRRELSAVCIALPIHLMILSRAEERELDFLARVGEPHKIDT